MKSTLPFNLSVPLQMNCLEKNKAKTIENFPRTQSKNTIFKKLSLLAMVLMLGVNGVMGQATLPVTGAGTTSGSNTMPSGFTQTGLGTAYSITTTPWKFDHQGDYVILNFTGDPGTLSYNLANNTLSGSYVFDVLVSSDGSSYSTLTSHTSITSGTFSSALGSTIRYVKWIYTTKSGGNVGLGSINLTASACLSPTVQTSNMTTSSIATTSSNYAFTRGNGTAGVLVVARPTSSAAVAPTSGSTYSANASYGSGSTTGTNNNVVYNSTSNGVSTATGNLSITGLTAGTQYTITAYEYNTTSTCYNTTSPASATFYTLCVPPATNTPSTVGSKSFTATWGSVTGASSYQLDVSTATDFSSFVSGYSSLSVSGTSRAVTDLNYNTTYYFRVRAVNAASTASANSNTSSTQTKTAATSLVLVGAPSTGNVGVNLTSFTVEARRNDATVDDAYTSSISITKVSGSGTISGNSAVAASSGSVTFASIQFNTADTYTISATDGTLTSATSGNIVITPVTLASDYFRSNSGNTGSGATLANASNWQSSSDNNSWITATSAPTSAANTITIRSGHNISIGSSITLDQLVIEAGATLTNSSGLTIANGTGTDLTVAGTLTQTVGTAITTTGTIAFTSTGIYNHQTNGGTIPTASWDAASTCNITGMTFSNPAGLGQTFGNFIWNNASQTSFYNFNNSLFSTAGTFTVTSTGSSNISLIGASTSSLTYSFGNIAINGGVFNLSYMSTATGGFCTVNVANNVDINAGTFSFAANSGNPSSASYVGTLNISGNLTVASGAFFGVTGSGSRQYGLVTMNKNGSQSLSVIGTSNIGRIDYNITSTSVTTLTNNLTLGKQSATAGDVFTVNGTLNTGTYTISQGLSTNATFTIASGGTLITSNTSGIGSTITVGGTKTYTAGANYTFNGVTSTPFPSGTFGNPATININAAVTSNLAATLVVTSALNINNGGTFTLNGTNNLQLNTGVAMTIAIGGTFDNGGTSQIVIGSGSPTIVINGKFITRDLDGFVGTNTTIPSITPTLGASSEIEYAASSGTQIVNAAPSYVNLTITNGGTKSPSNAISVSGTLTINTAAIFDGTSRTIGSASTNLTINGTGKLIVGGTGTKPEITGTFTLSPNSTIEFSNSAGTTQTIRASIAYTNVSITGSNVTLPQTASISNLTINTGGYLYLSGNKTVNDLNLTNGKFDIGGYTLTINGIVTRTSGNFVGSASSSLILNGNTNSFGFDQTTPGTTNLLKNLTVSGSGTSTLGNALNIIGGSSFGVVTVGSGATLATGGFLTLKSDANGTACIGNSAGSVTGNVTVERYIAQGKRAFRLVAPGVTTTNFIKNNWQVATHITGSTTGANGFDITATGNPSMYTYSNQVGTGTGWTAIANTDATNLEAEKGYRLLVRGDRTPTLITAATADNMNTAITLSATGTLKTGTVTIDASSSPTAINNTSNTTTNGFSLVANPYVSPIDWNLVTKSGLTDTYYVWDTKVGTAAQRGRYVSYSTSSGINNYGNSGASAANNIIQSGQAFFVKNTTLGTAGTLTFNESNKSLTSPFVLRTNNQNTLLSVLLYAPTELSLGGYPIDGITTVFGADFDNQVGYGDVTKLESAGENLAWFAQSKKLDINAQAPAAASDVLAIKSLRLGANKSYTFRIKVTNFDTSLTGYLVDNYLNTQQAIDMSQDYFATFSTTSDALSFGEDRFKIVFSTSLNNDSFESKGLTIYPNPVVDSQFSIQLPTSVSGKLVVKIHNALGQEIYQTQTDATNTLLVNPKQALATGVYIVSVNCDGKEYKQKIMVK